MPQLEVFVPTDGPLQVPGALADGPHIPTDMFRKERPPTRGFGQLSHNAFFTRHNPHPVRVRHLKGLLDTPICAVNDDLPSYSYNLTSKDKGRQLPVNAINVNSQMHPINTITGLQYFTGLQSGPYREKAVPRIGMGEDDSSPSNSTSQYSYITRGTKFTNSRVDVVRLGKPVVVSCNDSLLTNPRWRKLME